MVEKRTLDGRAALVTGAASGIGAACARQLARDGARVLVADVDLDAAERTAAELGGDAVAVRTDVGDPDSVAMMVSTAREAFGELHLAVNNAGISRPHRPLTEYSDDDWQAVTRVNLDGVFYCLRAELAAIAAAGGGAIVNVASILGLVGGQGVAPYVAAKHGVVGLTRLAALENARVGIRVNAVAPGFIETPLLAAESRRMLVSATPQHRLGQPEEVAEMVSWLLSDAASFVTGTCLPVDGGYTAQ